MKNSEFTDKVQELQQHSKFTQYDWALLALICSSNAMLTKDAKNLDITRISIDAKKSKEFLQKFVLDFDKLLMQKTEKEINPVEDPRTSFYFDSAHSELSDWVILHVFSLVRNHFVFLYKKTFYIDGSLADNQGNVDLTQEGAIQGVDINALFLEKSKHGHGLSEYSSCNHIDFWVSEKGTFALVESDLVASHHKSGRNTFSVNGFVLYKMHEHRMQQVSFVSAHRDSLYNLVQSLFDTHEAQTAQNIDLIHFLHPSKSKALYEKIEGNLPVYTTVQRNHSFSLVEKDSSYDIIVFTHDSAMDVGSYEIFHDLEWHDIQVQLSKDMENPYDQYSQYYVISGTPDALDLWLQYYLSSETESTHVAYFKPMTFEKETFVMSVEFPKLFVKHNFIFNEIHD